jgi:hypothetical protein
MNKYPERLLGICLIGWTSVAGAAAALDDHFGPDEPVLASFGWQPGASCKFADDIGVVFHSNWQTRHWIKLDGKQVEFNGETEMSDRGWFQIFRADGFAVTMRLSRTGDRGELVPMVGRIVVERHGVAKTYEVKGSCGA